MAIGSSLQAPAQAPPAPNAFRYGVSYDFEIATARRTVSDKHDRGQISLVVYIWRPVNTTAPKVVLFGHGSTGAGVVHPQEPIEYIPRPQMRYFVERGYAVVVPIRRGIGPSGGTFAAECQFQSGKCSLEDYRALAGPALDDALADNLAVLDQVILGKLVTRDARILLMGNSRGGFLALRTAAARPENTAGVVSFAGGWISMPDVWPPEERKARVDFHHQRLRDIAKDIKAPTLWLYGSNDPFFADTITREMFEVFTQGGGAGKYVLISKHSLPSGHSIAQAPEHWERDVGEFLETLRK
jgi:pimeloyl-ACP methyl ester carboxylesterase